MANNSLKPSIGNAVVRVMKVNEISRRAFKAVLPCPWRALNGYSKVRSWHCVFKVLLGSWSAGVRAVVDNNNLNVIKAIDFV